MTAHEGNGGKVVVVVVEARASYERLVEAMATQQKGSRLIVVDGQRYRWRVRHKPSYHQANGWSPLTFSVEQVEPINQAGTTLVVELPGLRLDCWADVPIAAPVLPSDVARLVRAARAAGWQPSQAGKPFRFRAG